VGQIAAQLLTASECRMIGVDPESSRIEEALKHGLMEGFVSTAEAHKKIHLLTDGHGADATLITASTASSEPTNHAFEITRKKGRIVVVGAVGMELNRTPFYEKEQDFLISCSYGPGRYDSTYEMEGTDYPYPYVRWTENRNMAAFLDLVASDKISVEPLVGAEFSILEAQKAYQVLGSKTAKPLSVLLSYLNGAAGHDKTATTVKSPVALPPLGQIRLAIVGAGEFVRSMHVPNLKRLAETVQVHAVCSSRSAAATALAKHLKAPLATSDYNELLKNPNIDAVLITTRHNQHARMAEAALKAGKHVFVEKPLALEMSELESLETTVRQLHPCPVLVVGFNRRYSPSFKQVKSQLARRTSPLLATYRVNAGELPAGHWVNSEEGGGRLRGEACHMIDFFQALTGSPLVSYSIESLKKNGSRALRPDENFAATFSYEDGSLCQLVYTSIGHPQLPKESIEVHWDGQSAVIDDFSNVTLYGNRVKEYPGAQDKGHAELLNVFVNAIKKGVSLPVSWDDLKETTQAAIELNRSVWGTLS
jgi:predicted dehydrogenase